VVSFVVSGAMLFAVIDRPWALLFALALAQLVLGMWTASAALFFSTWLPMMLASTASLGSLGLLGLAGYEWPGFTPARLLFVMTQGDLGSAARLLQDPTGLIVIVVGAVILFAAGTAVFEHRDLALKSD
jgi:hypothetical protein